MDDAKNENCIKKSILNNVEIRIDALTVSVKPLFYRVFFSSFGTGPDVRFSEAELSDVFESSSTLQAFIATIAKWKCSKKTMESARSLLLLVLLLLHNGRLALI